MSKSKENDKLPAATCGEVEMPNRAHCKECGEANTQGWVEVTLNHGGAGVEVRAILECIRDKHQWPLLMRGNDIVSTAPELPAAQSHRLDKEVPQGIKEDAQEAERAHAGMNYKASVVMCRRAIQLQLEDKLGTSGKTLGPLLEEAQKQNPPIFSSQVYALAERVKDYGDGGAHRQVTLDPKTVEVIIHDSVDVLNKIVAWKPASQSEKGNNEA